jgi:uncharacterized protein with HEPN domain
MHPDSAKLLWDAQLAAQKIARFTAGKTFAQYEADELLRAGVERQFEIAGEALNQLSRLDAETASGIPDLPRIVAFRNVLIHGYASVMIAWCGALWKAVWRPCWRPYRGLWKRRNSLGGRCCAQGSGGSILKL